MAEPHGALLVDKPRGKTSHDVVSEVRRILKTRRVGHAGTLDPMATGLLILLVGDATRIAPYFSDEDKRYRATIALGVGTDSLDADGAEVERLAIDDSLRAELRAGGSGERLRQSIATELARTAQLPPAISAIHVDGERAYERARRGEEVVLAPRDVRLRELLLVEADPSAATLTIELTCSKGYYVRSLARDLGASLGVPAHLTALRRLASGGFDVADAVALSHPETLRLSLRSTLDALARTMPLAELTDEGALKARQGKVLDDSCFVGERRGAVQAWVYGGVAIAIGGEDGRILRGFPTG